MNMGFIVGLGLVATLASLATTDAATYAVGENALWTFQSSNDYYNTWASKINFIIGDVLVFNFPTGAHNVATVTKAKYDDCDGDSPLALATVGPANITLTMSGLNYFICTVAAGDHCKSGLKLTVNVNLATNGTAPPPTSTTPTPSPSPSSSYPSSSSPLVVVRIGSSSLMGMIGIVVMGMVMV